MINDSILNVLPYFPMTLDENNGIKTKNLKLQEENQKHIFPNVIVNVPERSNYAKDENLTSIDFKSKVILKEELILNPRNMISNFSSYDSKSEDKKDYNLEETLMINSIIEFKKKEDLTLNQKKHFFYNPRPDEIIVLQKDRISNISKNECLSNEDINTVCHYDLCNKEHDTIETTLPQDLKSSFPAFIPKLIEGSKNEHSNLLSPPASKVSPKAKEEIIVDQEDMISIRSMNDSMSDRYLSISNHKDLTARLEQVVVKLQQRECVSNLSKEMDNKQKIPISYRFVLMIAILGSVTNALLSISSLIGGNPVLTWIIFVLLRFLIFNAPLLCLLSHEQARQFMKHRIKRNYVNVKETFV